MVCSSDAVALALTGAAASFTSPARKPGRAPRAGSAPTASHDPRSRYRLLPGASEPRPPKRAGLHPTGAVCTSSVRARPPTTAISCGLKRPPATRSRSGRDGTSRPSACWRRACSPSTASPRRSRSAERLLGDGHDLGRRPWTGRRDRARAGRLRRGRRDCSACWRPIGEISASRRVWRGGRSSAGARRRLAGSCARRETRPPRRHGVPGEQLAWFHLRLGDLALRAGQLAEAGRELDAGLRILPGGLPPARREGAARGRPSRLAPGGGRRGAGHRRGRSIPRRWGCCHDAYTALGDSGKAAEYSRAMDARGARSSRAPTTGRGACSSSTTTARCLACSARCADELRTRRDVYGYDLLAWALHRSGRDLEARSPMRQALSLGTRDAMLHYHAGMIELAIGDTTAARGDASSRARDQSVLASDAARRGARGAGLPRALGAERCPSS